MPVDMNSTNEPSVMEMNVSLWITSEIWVQVSRAIHTDDAERSLLEIYDRVYRAVRKTHQLG
jgi:hypothetical protein